MPSKKSDVIEIIGARVHNLKNVSLKIKRNSFTVFTGLSGSGKSSLAFDTLYAEGQRRYVESLSSYARQFLGKIEKPAVDHIIGISPAIAIEQKVHSRNPRSTVGTVTEIYEYLKLFFARIGRTYDPETGEEVRRHNHRDVIDFILKHKEGTQFYVLAPAQVGDHPKEWLKSIEIKGFSRLFYQDEVMRISEFKIDAKTKADQLFVLIDRFEVAELDEDSELRLTDAIQAGFYEGRNQCAVFNAETKKYSYFNKDFESNGRVFVEPSLHLFSFNNPLGACRECEGFGNVIGIDPDLVIPDKSLSLYEGAVACWRGEKMKEWLNQLIYASEEHDIPIHKAFSKLTNTQVQAVWNGGKGYKGINDFFRYLERKSYKIQYRVMLSRYKGKTICPLCHGTRLVEDTQYIKINDKDINELVLMPVESVNQFIQELELDEYDQQASKRLLMELKNRLGYLMDVGLGYLTLNRGANTLSGGESQRIQLSTSLGSSLVGSMYILDEPSIGLHPRDTSRLISVLHKLNKLGNTLVVVEHDEDIIEEADEIVDLGPEAGQNGGNVVFQGNREQLSNSDTLTSEYIFGKKHIAIPKQRRKWRNYIEIKGAYEHNLKNIDCKIPLQVMTCVTGVSGSGKSTLIKDVLHRALYQKINNNSWGSVHFEGMGGQYSNIDQIELIDQNPIGKSSRSNPVTYLKIYDEIRSLFSSLPEAKLKGMKPSDFSFNVDGGRCDVCKGEGEITVEMQFMSDIKLTCDECKGHRFKDEILEIKFNEHSISDVLELTVSEAMDFFAQSKLMAPKCKKIVERLRPLSDVGLDYVHLGQSSSTLSGGEAQRVKLAFFLSKGSQKERILFLFDEPSTGLHFHDINKLLNSMNALISNGHTVVIIEHHLDIIKCADWIIDLGPEGGDEGGNIVFEGLPEEIVKVKESHTGQYLQEKIKP